jgi:Cu+-exporting ATPase
MKWIAIDKTGTLTEGKPKLIEWKGADRLHALGIAAAIQTGSEHPLAKAIHLAAQENGIDLGAYPSTSHRALPGLGIEASVLGANYALGSERLLKTHSIPIPSSPGELGTLSFLVHLESLKVEGVFLFQDEIKTGARKFVQGLKELGLRVVILSGDRNEVVESVARSLEILDFKGELMPEEKAQMIFDLQRKGEVVGMIGDGVNDAPSLAAANVGIALSTGTDVAMQTAGITLMGSDPGRALEAIEISRKTYSRIRQNLTWAFIYNGVCIPLAASGLLSPTLAGAAMALSSVSVVLNSLRR